MGSTTVCVGIRTPRKNNKFLVDRIPGVQWVILMSSVGISRLFNPETPKDPRNAGGFVYSPAFWKQRPEGAVNQNTTWHESCALF